MQENHRVVDRQREKHSSDQTAHEEVSRITHAVATSLVNMSEKGVETLLGLLDLENLEAAVNECDQETWQHDIDDEEYVRE